MAKQISSLSVALFATVAPFATGLKSAEKSVGSFLGSIGGAASGLLKLTGVGALVGAALGAITSIGKGFSLASQLEQAQVAFETMLGSADAAKQVLGDLSKFAASTPFQLTDLVAASKQLIAFGVTTQDLMPDLKMIGDIASGVGAPIGEMAGIFGKVAVAGKLTGETLKQLQEHGVPISKALANQFHVPQAAIAKMVEEGQVSFGQLSKAFASMTGPGGQFAGMMDKQSRTVAGLMSTLADSVELSLAKVATTIIDTFDLRDGIRLATTGMDVIGGAFTDGLTFVAPYLKRFGISVYNTFAGIWTAIEPSVERVGRGVEIVWGMIVGTVNTYGPLVLGAATAAFDAVYNYVAPIMVTLGTVIADNWQSILTTTVGLVESVWNVVSAGWGALVDIATGVWSGITTMWTWGVNLVTGSTQQGTASASQSFAALISVGQWLESTFSTIFNTLSYAITHWRDTVELVGIGTALAIVRLGNQAQYVLGTVVPTVAKWFANNWRDIFTDVWHFTEAVFTNLGHNIVAVVKNIPGLINGSVNFSDLWTPLTDGFKSALKELPNIPERQMGALESALDGQVKTLQDKYGDGLGKFLGDKAGAAKDQAAKLVGGIKSVIDGSAIKPPVVGKPTIPNPDPLKATINPQTLEVGIAPHLEKGKAIRSNSAESQSLRYQLPLNAVLAAAGAVAAQNTPKPPAGKIPPGTLGGQLAPPVAPTPTQPITPTASIGVPKDTSGGDKGGTSYTAMLEELKKQTYWQIRIEQDVRGNTPTLVSIS